MNRKVMFVQWKVKGEKSESLGIIFCRIKLFMQFSQCQTGREAQFKPTSVTADWRIFWTQVAQRAVSVWELLSGRLNRTWYAGVCAFIPYKIMLTHFPLHYLRSVQVTRMNWRSDRDIYIGSDFLKNVQKKNNKIQAENLPISFHFIAWLYVMWE